MIQLLCRMSFVFVLIMGLPIRLSARRFRVLRVATPNFFPLASPPGLEVNHVAPKAGPLGNKICARETWLWGANVIYRRLIGEPFYLSYDILIASCSCINEH